MKKLAALFIVLCITASLFALEEVRGIETRIAKYPATGINNTIGWCRDGMCAENAQNELAGFELKNGNNYPVWVELELYKKQAVKKDNQIIPESIVMTKNITLEPGEIYLWKTNIVVGCKTVECYRTAYDCRGTSCKEGEIYDIYEFINDYYIKYKAYKADTGNSESESNNSKKSKKK